MSSRSWRIGALVLFGCAGAGEVERSARPARAPYGVCATYTATTNSEVFARAERLFMQAEVDYRAERDEIAARGYFAAALGFAAALVEDPKLAAARTNMRIAYADSALVWLTMSRHTEARATLVRARSHDPAMQAHWQRAIDELPRPPACAFKLEPAPVVLDPAPAPAPVVAEPVVAEPVVHEACGKRVELGQARRKHEFIGKTVAELDESGGEILCGKDPIWQLRFGTLCGDMASFHKVITVDVQAGRVTRVWEREKYNSAFCASQF